MSNTNQTVQTLTINEKSYTIRDGGAVRADAPQDLTEAQKAQARANIGIDCQAPVTDEKYFDIDYDGLISLKPEYRGAVPAVHAENYPFSESNNGPDLKGSLNHELPEKIVVPSVINGTAVSGFQAGTFYRNYRIKELTIPDGVEELPDGFCSGAMNLKSIHNTEQVRKIGRQFLCYTQVEKLLFPNLREAAGSALAACGFLYMVDIGNYITDIPEKMFYQCGLLSVVRGGGSVKTVGNFAFTATRNLKNLPLLSNVTSIGEHAFYESRIQFDWSTIEGQCTFAKGATPVRDNTTDFWTGVEIKDCKNPLTTLLSQQNPQWKKSLFGNTGKQYVESCAVFVVMHIHSALTRTLYTEPDEFAEELAAIDESLITLSKFPGNFDNVAPMFQALGHKTTECRDTITKDLYSQLCTALKNGAYIYAQISTIGNINQGHVVAIYGINEIGEVLVLDSNTIHYIYSEVGVDDVYTYRMPLQNLCGTDSNFVIVESGE